MKEIDSIDKLKQLSDNEIEEFFKDLTFRGNFTDIIRSKKNPEKFRGSISNITIEGRPSDLCPLFLNVPTFCNIEFGLCEFNCTIFLEALREKQQYILNIIPRSLHNYEPDVDYQTKKSLLSKTIEERTKDLFERWGVDSCEFIGYYCENEGQIEIKDIHKVNFDRIPYYPDDEQQRPITIKIPFKFNNLKFDNYYLFKWKLADKNPHKPFLLHIDSDYQPKPISPKWFIDTLFFDRYNDKSRNFGSATNFLDTLSKQLSAKESTFIYELLQNANDYPFRQEKVDVEFHITDKYLLFMHTGDYFNIRNISGICGINEKEKAENKKTIGYKGIGFKTVFLNNHYVYLRTGGYSFRFDGKADKIKRINSPWPILPIWTENNELESDVIRVFDPSSKKFKVQFALRPTNPNILHFGKNSYSTLLKNIFQDANIILFVPNINSVKVFIKGVNVTTCIKDSETWHVSDYEESISPELRDLINKKIESGKSRIPEKYIDFTDTKVSFACRKEGSNLKAIENGLIYCYLPTSTTWGFPFLMNTDMIPKGDRDDIETEVKLDDELNFNSELSSIAGQKFFTWIKDLMRSRQYDLRSVFSLIPNFESCKKEHSKYYDDFILKFRTGFENRLLSEALIPVQNGFKNINSVICDKTDIFSSNLFTDEEFYSTQKEGKYSNLILPLNILRKSKEFTSFFNRYINDSQKFEWDDLKDLLQTDFFVEWLKKQENNNKLLQFLISKNKIHEFKDEKIFLGNDGLIHKANELYLNVDDPLHDLKCFANYLPHLSLETRNYFNDDENWHKQSVGIFKPFNPNEFVTNELLNSTNLNSTVLKLNDDIQNSVNFFHFLAINELKHPNFKKLPFWDHNNKVVANFDSIIFFYEKKAEDVRNMLWMEESWINIINEKYFEIDPDIVKSFFSTLDVHGFSDNLVLIKIVLDDKYQPLINQKIQNWEANRSFVKYTFENNSKIEKKTLQKYVLRVVDKNGNKSFQNDVEMYFRSGLYEHFESREWIESDWMYSLDESYFDSLSTEEIIKPKEFFESFFGVYQLTNEYFYDYVVRKNLDKIFKKIHDENCNIDFFKFLSENSKHIFESKNDKEKYNNLPILDINGVIALPSNFRYRYAIDDKSQISDIINNNWFPGDIVLITSEKYIQLFSNYSEYNSFASYLGYNIYNNLNDFFGKVIMYELEVIKSKILTLDVNVEFHDYFSSNVDSILPDYIRKIKALPVFLYNGENDPLLSNNSTGHYIISDRQNELFELFNEGIILPSQICTIDLHYKKNNKYWGDSLDNIPFTLKSFREWSTSDKNKTTIINLLNKDSNININFWRWVKRNYNNDEEIKAFCVFPVIVLNNDQSQFSDPFTHTIYLSDKYFSAGKGLEKMVSMYYKDVLYVTSKYLENDTDEIKLQWKEFFEKTGIRGTIKELIFDSIIPNLSKIEVDTLPQLLSDTKYINDIEDNWENLKSKLINLRVKTLDGQFCTIGACILIDLPFENEPFKFILLPNELNRTYYEDRNTKKLLFKIAEYSRSKIISNQNDWRQLKLDQYLIKQDKKEVEVSSHFEFIKELAFFNIDESKNLKSIDKINLLKRNNIDYENPKNLTLGSIYKPTCDFEGNGIGEDTLIYISNSYKLHETDELVRKLLSLVFKVHYKFTESDIRLLNNRQFAIYFWSNYTINQTYQLPDIKELFDKGKFTNVICIPTKDNVKKAEELYSRSIKEYVVEKTVDWENKLPAEDIPDGHELLQKLCFKESLDFVDGLNALLIIKDAEKRLKIINWIIQNNVEASNVNAVNEYRNNPNALWKNGKQEFTQIAELYALDPSSSYLCNYFNYDCHIINQKLYFPDESTKFFKICSLLQIPVIKDEDMEFRSKESILRNDILRKTIELRLLIAAGIESSDDFEELFENYKQKLKVVQFWECSSISLTYRLNPIISQTTKKIHIENENIYYVKKWDNRQIFEVFVNQIRKLVGCKVAEDLFKNIFDSDESIEVVLEEYCLETLKSERFRELLSNYDPAIVSKLSAYQNMQNESETEEEESDAYKPKFINDVISNDDNDNDLDKPETKNDQNQELIEEDDEADFEVEENEDEIDDELDVEDEIADSFANRYSNRRSSYSHRTEPPKDDDFSEKGVTSFSFGSSRRPFSINDYKPTTPQNNHKPITEWKKNVEQANLGIADATQDELNAARGLIEGSKSNEEIIDEHYLARYRLYNALLEKGIKPDISIKDFLNNETSKISTNQGYIYTRSAKGGILYISSFLWNKIQNHEGRLCMYYGNKACDFEIIESIDKLIEYVGDDNIIIQIKGEDKKETISSVFAGRITNPSAHVLIRIKSNERYNSLFATVYSANENNDTDF